MGPKKLFYDDFVVGDGRAAQNDLVSAVWRQRIMNLLYLQKESESTAFFFTVHIGPVVAYLFERDAAHDKQHKNVRVP